MTAPLAATTIFDGDHLRAMHCARGHDRLIVTFDFRTPGKSGFSPANPSSRFDAAGFDQIMLRTARNDWFVNADTARCETALARAARGYAAVHTLGWSMGGYGALRFARALGASRITVVSPQVSVHPDIVPFDRRYRAEAAGFDRRAGDLAIRATPDATGAVLYDPMIRGDRLNAAMIGALFPGLARIALPFGGHPATGTLRDGGRAWVVQKCALAGATDAPAIRRAHRAARRASAGYWTRLARRAGPRRPALAERALDHAERLDAQGDSP